MIAALPTWAVGAAGLALGGGLGAVHFTGLRLNARLYVGGGAASALALHCLRLVATGVAFWIVVRLGGATALLAALAGFLLARAAIVRRPSGGHHG